MRFQRPGNCAYRGPQSVQSVPSAHSEYDAPGPPSSQVPSEEYVHVSVQELGMTEMDSGIPKEASTQESTAEQPFDVQAWAASSVASEKNFTVPRQVALSNCLEQLSVLCS